jgi:hypothetical protein
MFVRVVEREAWEVEVPGGEGRSFSSRQEAIAFAASLGPTWIEVGTVIPEQGSMPRHHRWMALRRTEDGSYAASGLRWGGRPRQAG